MEKTTLANRLEDQIAGVCLIGGALLMAPNTFFEYSEAMLFAAGVFGLLVYALLIPGLTGIARLLRQDVPRLSVITSLLATLGCVAGATFSTAILHEWAARAAGTPEPLMTAILQVTEGRVFPVLVILGVLFPFSLILLSIGLFRTGAAPGWVAVLLGIGAVVFPVGHIRRMQLITHLAETVLLIPMVFIGLRFLTGARPTGVTRPATA